MDIQVAATGRDGKREPRFMQEFLRRIRPRRDLAFPLNLRDFIPTARLVDGSLLASISTAAIAVVTQDVQPIKK